MFPLLPTIMTLTPEDEWMNAKISRDQYIIVMKYNFSHSLMQMQKGSPKTAMVAWMNLQPLCVTDFRKKIIYVFVLDMGWMSNNIKVFYMDVIVTYPCPNPNESLVNLF